MSVGIFPFGLPILPCAPSSDYRCRVFILGAYPSALHVSWRPPDGLYRPIKAIAVDNEPEPFWTGQDEAARIEAWKERVGFDQAKWGAVAPAGRLNGSSGDWVEQQVLDPLGALRSNTWITDCLDTYRCSDGLASRIDDTYASWSRT